MKTLWAMVVVSVTLMAGHARAGDPAVPAPELVGTWVGTAEIVGPLRVGAYPALAPGDTQTVTVVIQSDGTVTGGIGGATFTGAKVEANRGWLGRKLDIKTDFILRGGRVVGKVTPQDPGTDRAFTLPFNLKDGKIVGSIMLLPEFPLTRGCTLTKQEPKT